MRSSSESDRFREVPGANRGLATPDFAEPILGRGFAEGWSGGAPCGVGVPERPPVADLVAVIASIDPVMGEVDR